MRVRFRTACLIAGCVATLLAAACSTPTSPDETATSTPATTAPATAMYRVIFQATWSATTHPVDIPSTPHFSRLVGGTHNGSTRFWAAGALASAGIKDMSEEGNVSPLDEEVSAAVTAGGAALVLLGDPIPNSPGSASLEFQIPQTHPLVTLVSMVAPSPGWFVGVSALALFENGQWVAERRIDLVPWDAGTDSGSTFMSPNQVTAPPQPIRGS